MEREISVFERVVRRAFAVTEGEARRDVAVHPFDERNIHQDLPREVRNLFDNGHYSQATFEAFKFVDEQVQQISGLTDFGKSLMMRVFGGSPPRIKLNNGMTPTEESEQEGYKFIFAGAMAGIRNPRGHKTGIADDPDTCLDHLSLASMLIRRLEEAGYR